ncbi:MAG: hypothetical protein ABSC89_05395 [Verrucomicrobiota bacterium]|jgi:hypothetical protein
MKTYFIILCLLISTGLASASIQTAVSQDKPPHVYVKSYKMNDQVSGIFHWEGTSGVYAGSWQNLNLTCNANFYGLMDGTNGFIGAGAADMQMPQVEQYVQNGTNVTVTGLFQENMVEQDVNSVPAILDTQEIIYDDDITYYDGTSTNIGMSFPIYLTHCDINAPSFTSASVVGQYEYWSYTRRRGAQAVLKLQTGGKATSRLRNVIGLTGSAVQAIPTFPDPSFTSHWGQIWLMCYWGDHVSGTNIPSQQISIGSYGNLNGNGVLYKILPDNTEVDVTPQVSGSDYYTFNVSPQKYYSYFDLYVEQPNPGYSFLPIYNGDFGHAFWSLRTDAPSDALQYISSSLRAYLGTFGFYPGTNGSICSSAPGQVQNNSGHAANVKRTFYIGYPNLLNALAYVRGISQAPPPYCWSGINCVAEAVFTGGQAGVHVLPGDQSPQNFGAMLVQIYPGPFFDTNDVFTSLY